MSKNNGLYNVLWIDEDADSMTFKEIARKYNINVYQTRSWERGKIALANRFESYSAIVLDGNCVIKDGDEPTPDFLYQAVREMESIFAQHEERLPWYVLSSGSAPDFEKTIQRVSMGERAEMEEEWGRLFYRKGQDLDDLCIAIKHAAARRKDNKIRTMYADVFRTMDFYFTPDARQTMLVILKALHFPEESRDFDPVLYYTQLRRILEHLFRACNRLGMLPDEVLGPRDKVNLANSSLYLSGREVNLGSRVVRYKRPGQYIFPPVIAQIVKSILVVANKNSHTVELDTQGRTVIQDYYNSLHSNNFLFGYALHLCDVIIWFGRYARKNYSK
ncbi:MAG: hypothetical protein IKS36_04675 [Bacteroidales bacterium]|nr:hypothetical protein [Bacteroidales bacterium]MCR5064849.1 hypothetical protein [Bacteroidales bacterium]